ncbi:TTN [Mytilus coruscus]|uniref:TTN n=1 Tax=Mytilus coruscus TaxID=42192 RepID=A0A6J8C089_MYTCO|nr:TTN [Mytilus coruscus]
MKVLQFNSSEDVCYSNIKTKLTDLVDSIKLRYRINVSYDIRFKCHGGSLIDNKGIAYDEAMEKGEYLCTDHKEMHSSKQIYRFWLKEEEVEEELNMFRRPLVDVTIMEGLDTTLEFETEEENVPVQWFYNRKEIIESNERRQISRLQGRVHTLTILQTRLEDSGKYSIKIKGYDKIVKLNVKGIVCKS